MYHVLGGSLSAIDGIGPEDLGINSLIERAGDNEVNEIILAMNATIDGQTTAYYITDQLKECDVKISRLAHGVPVGGELDYMDDGTLQTALKARQPF
jgi:recombination protein RecR